MEVGARINPPVTAVDTYRFESASCWFRAQDGEERDSMTRCRHGPIKSEASFNGQGVDAATTRKARPIFKLAYNERPSAHTITTVH